MGKASVVLLVIAALCDVVGDPHRFKLRRNGNFRVSKIIYLMKRFAPRLYAALMEAAGCYDDWRCVQAVKMVLQRNLLSFSEVTTLGDLCNEIRPYSRSGTRN